MRRLTLDIPTYVHLSDNRINFYWFHNFFDLDPTNLSKLEHDYIFGQCNNKLVVYDGNYFNFGLLLLGEGCLWVTRVAKMWALHHNSFSASEVGNRAPVFIAMCLNISAVFLIYQLTSKKCLLPTPIQFHLDSRKFSIP